ncbi:MAG TPA: hypothetical protein PK576_08685 [Kiritimatiellia bacterium]|nr:hypothetical protein [Kiritimatiellia bacterium]
MTNAMNATTLFGDGSIRIGGFSKFIINGQAYRCGLNPSTADGLLDFVVYDNGQFDASLEDATYLNNSALAGSVTRITASDSATVKFGHNAVVGYAAGSTGELILKDSVTCQNGLYGFTFGRGGSATDISTGILRMSGGTFTIGSSKTTTYPDLYGFVFGNGAATNATGEIWNKGFGYISGGTITVCQGIHIGDGNAYGFVEQSGGKIQMSNNNSYPVNVGNHHGTGVYRMTGGTFHTPNSTVSVGANNGNGMLEFGAGTGTCTAKNMNLAGVGATLKFVFGADGSVIKPNVTDTLTIDPGAKIVVDTTACAEPKSVDLMTFGAKSGSFADADIEIIGIKGALVSQSDAKLRLQINKGTVVIIR